MGSGASKGTHVANAYTEDIWVKVSSERKDVALIGFNEEDEMEKYNQERKFHCRFNRNYAVKNQFINIAPQNSLTFDTDYNRP